MYLPGFPAIAQDLGTTIDQIQLSLTAYLIGIAVGQLFYGPLLDRFGRKIPLYTGLVIYILASLACAFTTSVDALIAMRFIQAIGGCAGMVAAQALVRDLFPVNKTAQAFSLLVLVIAVSPMIAPTLGGYVTTAFGWHAIFILMAFITALIILAVYLTLPEGQLADRTLSLRPKSVLKNYQNVLKQPQFLVYMLAGGTATAAPLAYIAGSSDVFMNIYQVSAQEYGWIFAFLASAMIGSTQLNHILLKKFSSEQIIRFTLYYQTAIGLLLVAGTMYGWYGKTSLILLLFVFLTGQGLTNPNATALALAPFSKHAGSASALLGSFRLGIGGLASAAVSILHNQTAIPMVSVMALCAFTGLGLFLIGDGTLLHKLRQQERKKEEYAL
jgi:DHA1 family bicyclomycin/chloramphenicol resistance-like MFS transporter